MDHTVWQYAFNYDFAAVTTNARDARVDPGWIVLREGGLSGQEQWEPFVSAIEHMKKSGDEDFLLNKLIEITGVGLSTIREIHPT
ncbi:MAG TPA: hypothetical protein VMP68_28690 [Candidatus Eisenbacteria bacterium]|nr:hypothetical protein [Candidatus Eisenbacteria bacterium]